MNEITLPDLTLSSINYGKNESPWTLRSLAYNGGAGSNARNFDELISTGKLGKPIAERIPLIIALHDIIQGSLTGGGSRYTAKKRLRLLRNFYSWADSKGLSVTLYNASELYIEWTEHLLHRNKVANDLDSISVFDIAATVAKILDEALDLKIGLFSRTRIHHKKDRKPKKTEKTNLSEAFKFGNFLLDITRSLTVEVIQGPLPVKINLRTGQVLEEWSGLVPIEKVKALTDEKSPPRYRKKSLRIRDAWMADTSWRTRYPLINLRIEAELLIFISQTQMNLSQAHKLKAGKFSYQSHLDGYQVRRIYKGRRKGEVAFEIYSEYREIFDRYLEWLRKIFPEENDGFLFPIKSPLGRAQDVATSFSSTRKKCTLLGIKYIGPRELRKMKINWLMRHSNDQSITAEMAQHTQETLLINYNQPNHQTALIEISRFHAVSDPSIAPPGPGACVEAVPTVEKNCPPEAPKPDCISPAGCLFCIHQRDIDSADHAWSLASYRYYKSLELSRYRPSSKNNAPHPATAVIDRLTLKLKHFEESSETRSLWVKEGLARIEEGNFHPTWDGFIQLAEITQ